jgi:hypothetical protein
LFTALSCDIEISKQARASGLTLPDINPAGGRDISEPMPGSNIPTTPLPEASAHPMQPALLFDRNLKIDPVHESPVPLRVPDAVQDRFHLRLKICCGFPPPMRCLPEESWCSHVSSLTRSE